MIKGFSLPRSRFVIYFTQCAFRIVALYKFRDPVICTQNIVVEFKKKFPALITQVGFVPKSPTFFQIRRIRYREPSDFKKGHDGVDPFDFMFVVFIVT
jgi:hypothetical protein